MRTEPKTWCCINQDLMTSDTVHDEIKTVNRVCLGCYTHWYGLIGAVKRYTRQEWVDYQNRNKENEIVIT